MATHNITFASTGDVKKDIPGTTAVRAMRREAVDALLHKAGADSTTVRQLADNTQIVELRYSAHTYDMRRLMRRS